MEESKSSSDERVTLRRVRIRDAWVWETTDGRYIFWPDTRIRGWRWSKREWEDDGVGIQHHGAAATLEAAVSAALAHERNYPPFRA